MTPDNNYESHPSTEAQQDGSNEDVLIRHHVGRSLSNAGFGDVLVLSHGAADKALTPARRAIIQVLSEHDVGSLRELARHLDRNPGNLTRDLQVLVAEDIITYEKDGRSKRPELKHDTIIQEPLVSTQNPVEIVE